MQSPAWYITRLRAMSVGEVAWRVRSALRERQDRLLAGMRGREAALSNLVAVAAPHDEGFRVCAAEAIGGGWQEDWRQELLAKADAAAAGRLSFFDATQLHLGDPIDWNRDHRHGISCPTVFAGGIDCRDFQQVGDSKYVWEPNRHHHLVVLGRAYRATGDLRYAKAIVEQLDSWLEQNPFGMGMNWCSPLELAIRLINWVWAMDLIREADLIEGEFRQRLLNAVYRHLWDVDRKYSRGSSANNHLIGEAAGVFIGAAYFRYLKKAANWRAKARKVLLREIERQNNPDGGNREQAMGYHLFVLQFLLLAGLVARWTGEDFPESYWSRLEKMFEFLGVMGEGGEALPMFGDADDGYVLDLGGRADDVRGWLAVGACLFGRADFKAWAGGYSETAQWLLGPAGREKWDAIDGANAGAKEIASRAFPDTGYYLLQCGHRGRDDRISVAFDCGELGYLSIAAHGHADALSFTLRAFGVDVLVDPGTYAYFTYPQWRTYFRSTRAHNTIVVDGQDQSEMLGPFLWGKRAKARCVSWQPSDCGGRVVGEHDGYLRLNDPVLHRRTVDLDGRARMLTIRDEILAGGAHDVQLCFHLAEHCRAERAGDGRYEIDVGPGRAVIHFDPRLSVEKLVGGQDPIGGWVSRGYHRKAKSTTLVGRVRTDGNTCLVCRIEIHAPSMKTGR